MPTVVRHRLPTGKVGIRLSLRTLLPLLPLLPLMPTAQLHLVQRVKEDLWGFRRNANAMSMVNARDTQSISSNGMMQNPATCFAAKMRTASGGHLSHPNRCALPLKTAQSLGIQMLDHVPIASVERDFALQGNAMTHTSVMAILLILTSWHI